MRIKLDEGAYAPTRAHETDAGLDLYAREGQYVYAGDQAVFDTGVHVELQKGYAGLLVSKSGLNVVESVTSTGLIDEGYSGSIRVKLYNHGKEHVYIRGGQKISQLVLIPVAYEDVEIVDEIGSGERGENGFGSTDK